MFDFQKDCGIKVIKDLVKDSNLSRIYGFILYTEKDPFVAKVLRDDDFWSALDSISGSNWPIFAVRPLKQGSMRNNSASSKHMSFLVSTWDEPKSNIPIIEDFGIEDSQDLPLFVAFMWDDEDNINELTIPILGSDTETIYHSIEEIVKTIAHVESAILPEYKGTINVFRNVKTELESLKMKHAIISRGKKLYWLAEFFNMFR